MNKYIFEILKESSTVIIPGLGALTITNREKGEFMFMPYLKHDDGKLSGFIAETDGIDETEAKNQVAKYVREILGKLNQGDSFDVFQLGTFSKDADGEIEFTPSVAHTPVKEPKAEEKPSGVSPKVEKPGEEPAEKKTTAKATTERKSAEKKTTAKKSTTTKKTTTTPKTADEKKAVDKKTPTKKTTTKKPVADKSTTEKKAAEKIPPVTVPKVEAEKKPKEVLKPTEEEKPFVEETSKKEVAPALEKKAVVAKAPEIEKKTPAKEPSKKKEKKKRSAGFWFLMVFIVLLVAGGTAVGIFYDEIKQQIPFLADEVVVEEENKHSQINEMRETLGLEDADETYADSTATDDQEPEDRQEDQQIEEAPVQKDPIAEEPDPTPIVSSSSGGPYHIVGGAFSSIDNANRYAEKLKSQGLDSKVMPNGATHIVTMGSYESSVDANAALSQMKGISPSAWVTYRQ